MLYSYDPIQIDPAREVECITTMISDTIRHKFNRKGAIIGLSGGVDSATVLALATRSLGKEYVIALILPDRDSDPLSEILARQAAERFGVKVIKEDLTMVLDALGCYREQEAAVKQVFIDFAPDRHKMKLVLPSGLMDNGSLNVYWLALVEPEKPERRKMLPPAIYLAIVAATNMKQRTRMLTLYHHAEKRNFAVIGTANKNEHDQGFFVKYGDGGADLQPIQHLYKTQVYQLAQYLGVPEEIIKRPPTTDTYSAACSQEEFYFRLPFELMDRIWYGLEQKIPAEAIAEWLELDIHQIERVYRDLSQKARTTAYLRTPPVTVSLPSPDIM